MLTAAARSPGPVVAALAGPDAALGGGVTQQAGQESGEEPHGEETRAAVGARQGAGAVRA